MKKLLLLTAVLAALATPVFAESTTSCVRQNDIKNWTSLNDKNIVLENYRHQKVLLKLIGTCSDFRFSEALEIRSRGGDRLSCVGIGDTIVTHRGITGRCSIVSVTPYTGSMNHHDHDADNHDGDHHDHGSY